jgi:diacylglycerol kinase (ATP)
MASSPQASALVVAINPTAQKGRARLLGREVVDSLRGFGFPVDVVSAESEAKLSRALTSRLDDPHRALITVGGDGIVHTALQVLADHPDTPVGVIPGGTGNDVARALGMTRGSPLEAVSLIVDALESPTRRIDLGEAVHGEVATRFAAVYSAGFDALVNERANRLRFPTGPSRYTVAMLLELATLTPRRYRLEIDGDVSECEALLVAVANAESFGGGMRVVPGTPIDDGLLQVFTLAPLSRLSFVRLYPRVFSGRHIGHPAISVTPARKVTIESADIVGYADGERMESLPVDIRVLPGALKVLAP